MNFVARCEQCGIIESGDLEDAGDVVDEHEQFHDVQVQRVATDGGQSINSQRDVSTYTRLDIDERYELLKRLEAIDPGEKVRLSYDSSRSSNDQTVEGRVVDCGDDAVLYAFTDDLKGDVYVDVWNLESKHHAGLVVKTTGGRYTNRQPRLGELLAVGVIDDA